MVNHSHRAQLILALLLAICALGFLAFRVRRSLHRTPAAELLAVPATVPLPPPPPLPAGDRDAVAQRLAALEPLRAARRSNPGDMRILLELAEAAGTAGDMLTAREALQEAVKRSPQPDAGIYQSLGNCERKLGRYLDAARDYERVISLEPDRADGYVGACYAWTAARQPERALGSLEQASRTLRADDVAGHLAVAEEFNQRLNPVRALQELEREPAVARSEELEWALNRQRYRVHQFDAARSGVEAVLAKDPSSATAHRLLAEILSDPLAPHPDLALAEHHFLTALSLDPKDVRAWSELGRMLLGERRYREAAFAYIRFLELQPAAASGRFPLARAFAGLGDRGGAAEQRSIAERLAARDREEDELKNRRLLHPSDVTVRAALARHYADGGHYAEALTEIQSAYTIDPLNPSVRKTMSAIYAELGLPLPDRTGGPMG